MTSKQAIGAIVTGGVLAGLWFWRGHQIDNVLKTGRKTTAIIAESGGKNITVAFFANNTVNQDVLSKPYYNLYEGESYVLMYDPEDPKMTVMLFWQPVFAKADFTEIQPNAISETWEDKSTIKFEYTVSGKNYIRFQALIPGKKYSSAIHAKAFYKTTNPKIAYLQF